MEINKYTTENINNNQFILGLSLHQFQIDNNIEFSVELCLIEKEYNKLIDSLLL